MGVIQRLLHLLKLVFATVGVLVLLGIILVGILEMFSDKQTITTNLSSSKREVECYVDGKPIKATREVCAELSKQKQAPAQTVQQPSTTVQQPRYVAPIPRIEAPQVNLPPRQTNQFEQTNCRQMTDGSVRCYTKSF
jgi:type III secretory pathway component EscU